jgi:hypothetical protein
VPSSALIGHREPIFFCGGSHLLRLGDVVGILIGLTNPHYHIFAKVTMKVDIFKGTALV